jgi:hypothetical protein
LIGRQINDLFEVNCSIYNTLTEQIIPSQKPMIVDAAINFEKVINLPSNQKVIWKDIASVEK